MRKSRNRPSGSGAGLRAQILHWAISGMFLHVVEHRLESVVRGHKGPAGFDVSTAYERAYFSRGDLPKWRDFVQSGVAEVLLKDYLMARHFLRKPDLGFHPRYFLSASNWVDVSFQHCHYLKRPGPETVPRELFEERYPAISRENVNVEFPFPKAWDQESLYVLWTESGQSFLYDLE